MIRRSLQSWSGLYLDTNADFEVGDSERDSGSLMSGGLSMPGPTLSLWVTGQSMVSSDGLSGQYDQAHDGELRDVA